MSEILPVTVFGFYVIILLLYVFGLVRKHVLISCSVSIFSFLMLSLFDVSFIVGVAVCFIAYAIAETGIFSFFKKHFPTSNKAVALCDFENGHGKVLLCGRVSDAVCNPCLSPSAGSVVDAFLSNGKVCFISQKNTGIRNS